MSKKSLQNDFQFLQENIHHLNDDYKNTLPLDTLKDQQQNDSEYWLFSDLYNLFGYQYVGYHNNIIDTIGNTITFTDYQKLPKKNSENIARAPNFHNFYSGHVVSIINDYKINDDFGNTTNKKNGADARLSRYACWKIMKQWANMIFAQLYFMTPDATFEKIYNAAYKFSRIYQRKELKHAEKTVNGIAYHNHADMPKFNTFMHRAFFYTADLDSLKSTYNISGTILDYMGSQSLMSRRYALIKAINVYDQRKNMPFNTFTDILYNELIAARVAMIKSTGRRPESDISNKPVYKVASELKQLEQEFIKKYAYQSLR